MASAELVARQIHDLSPRRDGPFVAVNCAAIVERYRGGMFGIEDRRAPSPRADWQVPDTRREARSF